MHILIKALTEVLDKVCDICCFQAKCLLVYVRVKCLHSYCCCIVAELFMIQYVISGQFM